MCALAAEAARYCDADVLALFRPEMPLAARRLVARWFALPPAALADPPPAE